MEQRLAMDTTCRRPCSQGTGSVSSQAEMASYFPGSLSLRKLILRMGNAARQLRWQRGDSSTRSSAICSVVNFHGDSCGVSYNERNELSQTLREPDFRHQPNDCDTEFVRSNIVGATSFHLFQRPGFGSLSFFRHAGRLVSFLSHSYREASSSHERETLPPRRVDATTDSIGSVGSLATRITHANDTEQDGTYDSSLYALLAAAGVVEALSILQREMIDLDALVLLSDADLKEIGLPMGPRRKLLAAIVKQTNSCQ